MIKDKPQNKNGSSQTILFRILTLFFPNPTAVVQSWIFNLFCLTLTQTHISTQSIGSLNRPHAVRVCVCHFDSWLYIILIDLRDDISICCELSLLLLQLLHIQCIHADPFRYSTRNRHHSRFVWYSSLIVVAWRFVDNYYLDINRLFVTNSSQLDYCANSNWME